MQVDRSREARRRLHALIPGGAHTYAKGDDQYPEDLAPVIDHGLGCRAWDVDGNAYIEYGMGNRAVTLGHAHPAVLAAAEAAMRRGVNFVRPTVLEAEAAEALLALLPNADMVKFAKNGSDVTTAAVRLARAATGRDLVAVCGDQPFFSVDDWFIGTTPMAAGIPAAMRALTVRFPYNDLAGVEAMFASHPDGIAALVMEAATSVEPAPGYLAGVQALCRRHGALLVLDEIITGFRWDLHGAQAVYGLEPDLATFSKALGNGFSVAALVGRRELMELGGLRHEADRVFLLSTTFGAESHGLAAAIAVMEVYRTEGVVEQLYQAGERLQAGVRQAATAQGCGGPLRASRPDVQPRLRHARRRRRTVPGVPDPVPPGDDRAGPARPVLRRQSGPQRRRHRSNDRSGRRGPGGLPAGSRRRHRALPARQTRPASDAAPQLGRAT